MKSVRALLLAPILGLIFSFHVVSGDILITEIMYNPFIAAGGDTPNEFVEIYNSGPDPVDLSGWKLDDEDASDWDPISGVLGAGEVGVITMLSEVDFKSSWSTATDAVIFTSGGDWTLANSGSATNEILVLLDGGAQVVDTANYEVDANGWPTSINGVSIYLLPGSITQADNDNGANWLHSADGVDGAIELLATTGVFDAGNIASPGTVIVPEPSIYTLALGVISLAIILIKRRRR